MSLGTAQLSESLQALIDARLDTIDRMLLGRVARTDRLAIVREVESQVFELLHERGTEDLTREDVLAVLARLDPPEAYLPEDDDEAGRERTAAPNRVRAPEARRNGKPRPAKTSGIVGLSALAVVLFSPLIFLIGELMAEIVTEAGVIFFWSVAILATCAAGLLAIILGVMGRRGGAWAVVGMVAGAFSFLFACAAAILLIVVVGTAG
jgi:hypothetical protein